MLRISLFRSGRLPSTALPRLFSNKVDRESKVEVESARAKLIERKKSSIEVVRRIEDCLIAKGGVVYYPELLDFLKKQLFLVKASHDVEQAAVADKMDGSKPDLPRMSTNDVINVRRHSGHFCGRI